MDRIYGAMRQSLDYILSLKDEDTSLWSDFKTNHYGKSTFWVSSHIADCLLDSGVISSRLVSTAISLISNQDQDWGGWGYNKNIVLDANTTSIVSKFLSRFGDYEGVVDAANDFILLHKTKGFSTYFSSYLKEYNQMEGADVSGWCSEISEATAMAVQALRGDDEGVLFLLESQGKDGSWRGYWWNNEIYATSQAVFALKDSGFDEEIENARRWLVKQKTDNPLYVGLRASALMVGNGYRPELDKSIQFLLDNQQNDGSWESKPVLMFPTPENKEPWKDEERIIRDAVDQNRLLTTAVCRKALYEYAHR